MAHSYGCAVKPRPPRPDNPHTARLPVCVLLTVCVACSAPGPQTPKAHVYIPRGASLKGVTDSLLTHGVIETVIATSERPPVELRAVLPHRDPGSIPTPPGAGPPPLRGQLAARAAWMRERAKQQVPQGTKC